MNKTFLPGLLTAAISLTLAGSAMAAGSSKPITQNRAEIAPEFRWDFTPIYARLKQRLTHSAGDVLDDERVFTHGTREGFATNADA